MILSCNKVCKSYGATDILKDVTFLVNEKEKVGVIGVNGAGKSTLFKMILNEISKDSGEISFKKNISIGYLAQNFESDTMDTIFDVALSAFEDLIKLEQDLNDIQYAITNDPTNKRLIERYDVLNHEFSQNDGYMYKSIAKGVLIGLGFTEDELTRRFNTLSGGEKTRVLLGKILISNNDILLLDEPTNHLDIAGIEWLEAYLKNYRKAILIISHDRYFLDNVIDKVVEIENTKCEIYNGNYTTYSIQKEINREIQLTHYINQQKEVARQEEIIRTFRSYATERAIKRAKSKEKLLAKMELVEAPLNLPSTMSLNIKPSIQSGNDVIKVSELKKGYDGEAPLFSDLNFQIYREDKIAVIGDNGAGKSTLIKIITGKVKEDFGVVNFGVNVNIAYYDQEHQDLSEHKTIFEEISDFNPRLNNQEIRNALATFVFTGDDVLKKISTLSGGEKGRVALCKLMLSNANCLILDEPTNHLDMFSKEVLENAINNYTGTIIYISHDRYFINNTATKIFQLSNKTLNIYEGNYDNFIEKSRLFSENSVNYTSYAKKSNSKEDFLKQKEEQASQRKALRQLENCENRIEELEFLINECDVELAKKEVYTNSSLTQEIFVKKTEYSNELENLYEEWEKLQG
ncbi:MAG: ABC-F family ATP-binding cassette domain-containing protein [Lachnospirales bacterium]